MARLASSGDENTSSRKGSGSVNGSLRSSKADKDKGTASSGRSVNAARGSVSSSASATALSALLRAGFLKAAVAVQGNGATDRAVRAIATLAVFDVELIVKEAEPRNHT